MVVLESSNEARQPGNALQPGTESRKMTAGKKKGSSKRLLRTEFHSALCRGIAPPICAGVFTDQVQGALPPARRNKRVCSCQKKSENNKYRLVVSVFRQEFGSRQPFGVRFAVGVIAFLQSALTPNGKVRWGQPHPQEPWVHTPARTWRWRWHIPWSFFQRDCSEDSHSQRTCRPR